MKPVDLKRRRIFYMNWNAVWIQPEYDMGDIVPVYTKQFSLPKIPVRAVLHITALGVYEAH